MINPCHYTASHAQTRLIRSGRLTAWLCVLICVFLIVWNPPSVLAADIEVDDTDCSLADAITAANTDTETNGCTAGSGADTITLAANITLSVALPSITSEITIEGADYDIDGNDEYQIFYVDGGDLTINNITLTGGVADSFGGAIQTVGGSLTVTNSRLEDNEVGLLGGAIATKNTNVIIRNSDFVKNTSSGQGGAMSFGSVSPGHYLWTDDTVVKTLLIDQTTFGEGVPKRCDGAGINAHNGQNHADENGGAIRIAGGDVTIRRSSFVGNKADLFGGAIYAKAWRFLFENNTVSCNRADDDGGGMYIIVGDLILRHSTIYQNSAGDEGGGLFAIDDTTRDQENEEGVGLYLQNTIIAGSNGGGDCVANDTIDHNIGMLIGDGSCEPACSGEGISLNIGPLQGKPPYHPLLDESIAINRADRAVCMEENDEDDEDPVQDQTVIDFSNMDICSELDPKEDQIGTTRPMYGSCDIGSIESRTGVVPRNPNPTSSPSPPPPSPTEQPSPTQPPPTPTQPPPTPTQPPLTPTQRPPSPTQPQPSPRPTTRSQDPQDPKPTKTRAAVATRTNLPNLTSTAMALCRQYDNAATQSASSLPSDDSNVQAVATQSAANLFNNCEWYLATPTATASENQCVHTVVAGDTLFRLALNYGTSVDAIKYLNQLSGDFLFIGQQLYISGCYNDDDLESSNWLFICQSLFESIVVRSTSDDVSCREVDTETIDKHPLLAGGMLGAVEVLGYVDRGVEVCFRNTGTLVLLDPVTWPPTSYFLTTYSNVADMTCARVDRVGTIVLVAVLSEAESLLRLNSCQVTTRQILRLRDAVAGTSTLGFVPYNVTLQAIARTPNWFNVSFLGSEGWISALYVDTDGICE